MHFWKLLLNKFVTGSLKNPCPSAPNLPENLKNILGVGGRHKPNIFPITAKYLKRLDPCCISQALFIINCPDETLGLPDFVNVWETP